MKGDWNLLPATDANDLDPSGSGWESVGSGWFSVSGGDNQGNWLSQRFRARRWVQTPLSRTLALSEVSCTCIWVHGKKKRNE